MEEGFWGPKQEGREEGLEVVYEGVELVSALLTFSLVTRMSEKCVPDRRQGNRGDPRRYVVRRG